MPPVRLLRALSLGLLLAGCMGDEPEPPAPPPVGQPVPDAGGVTVTLTRNVRYLTATGEVVRSEALVSPVELIIPGESGDTRLSVVEQAPGRAVVRNVPEGVFWLRTGTTYVLSSGPALELGQTVVGRPDALRTGLTSARMRLSVSGLQPWNESPTVPGHAGAGAEDALQLFSPEAGAVGAVVLDVDPAVGSTALEGVEGEFYSYVVPPIPQLSAAQDTLHVMQQTLREGRSTDDALMHYTAVRKAAVGPAPEFSGAQPLVVSAALEDVTQKHYRLDLRAAELSGLATAVHPWARHNNTSFELSPGAYGEQNGRLGVRVSLLMHLQTSGDDVAAPLQYGNPFPSSWGEVGRAGTLYVVNVGDPWGGSVRMTASITVEDTAAQLGSAPVVARVLPPSRIHVDGTVANREGRALASLTPVLSWDAPTAGSPTHYEVVVRRLTENSAGNPTTVVAAILRLPASVRTLRLPEGVLEAGNHYVFVIGAHVAPGWTERPLAEAFPTAKAEAITEMFSAP